MNTLKLITRKQQEIENPSIQEIKKSINELFKSQDSEHPNMWLEYGFDSDNGWSIINLDLYESGLLIITKWEDQDDDDPIFETILTPSNDEIIKYFNHLLNKEIKEIIKP